MESRTPEARGFYRKAALWQTKRMSLLSEAEDLRKRSQGPIDAATNRLVEATNDILSRMGSGDRETIAAAIARAQGLRMVLEGYVNDFLRIKDKEDTIRDTQLTPAFRPFSVPEDASEENLARAFKQHGVPLPRALRRYQ